MAKSRLVEHYKKILKAQQHGSQLMVINTVAAKILIDKYFKNG
jgi:hypothetical protein